MQTNDAFRALECTGCGARHDVSEPGRCPKCDAPLQPVYDGGFAPESLADRPFDSMWRYQALLPFAQDAAITAAEGGTPLVEAPNLAGEIDVDQVLIKDEGRNPTGTILDRGMALAVTAAREQDSEVVALASPGNSGQSMAAYVGRTDLRSYAFVPSRTPFPNKAMTNVHGGEMRVVGGRYDDALDSLHDELETDWHSLQEFTTPYRHEGVKTAAFEIAEQLDWRAPDAVMVPTGTGEVLAGVAKGFQELYAHDVIGTRPKLVAVQPEGCAPIAAAWERGTDEVEPWEQPDTICGELEIPDPAGGRQALDALEATDGDALAVTDRDILQSAVMVSRHEVVEMGANAGASAAGAWELSEAFDADDTVVLLNTEAGAKTADILRSHLMGQGL